MNGRDLREGYNRLVIAYPKLPEFTPEIGDVWLMALEGFTADEFRAGVDWYITNGRYQPKPVDIRKACLNARKQFFREQGTSGEYCPKCNNAGFFFVEADGPDTVLLCDCGRCIDKDTPQRMREKWARQLARALADEAWELDKNGGIYRFQRKRRWIKNDPEDAKPMPAAAQSLLDAGSRQIGRRF